MLGLPGFFQFKIDKGGTFSGNGENFPAYKLA
jgi:hypothetical protein